MTLFEAETIAFSYGDRSVLRDISFTLEASRFYGILGPNGSGKSTLIDLLMGHVRPASGSMSYRKKSVSAISRRILAREMALVPQNFYINFPFTALEVVLMGRYPHMPRFSRPTGQDLEIVGAVMDRIGVEAFADRYITEMSGGERQRVLIARALAQDTPVLLLDEATSNLDIRHALRVLDILSADVRQRRKTVIAVFQDINLAAAYCDHLIFLKDGRVAECGETAGVLTEPVIREVFGVDVAVGYDAFSRALRVSFRHQRRIRV